MELIDNGGLTDTGISGNEHQLGPAAGHDAIERGEQRSYLGFSPVQFLGNQQPVRRVVFARLEFVDTALSFPFAKTTPKITLSAGCGLIALLSSFGEQLHNDPRHR